MALPPFAEGLRRAAPDRHIAILYAPAETRAALAALYAFDAETAGIRSRAREAMAGEIRLQWWRDALAAGAATGSPLADAVIETVRIHDLPLTAFDNLLEARIFDLYDDPMPSRVDLEGYLGETEGAAIQLAALVLDRAAAATHAALAGHAGCARGLAGIAQRLAREEPDARKFIPLDVRETVGLSSAMEHAALGRATEAVTALAAEHFEAFLSGAATLPASLRPAFLPLAVVPAALGRLPDPHSGQGLPAWRQHWPIFRAASRGWPAA